MMKKNILGVVFALLVFSSVGFAQTFTERQEIISDYDLDKLAQMEAEYAAEFVVEKEEALRLAAINGWEEIIQLPNGGIAMLVGVFENGSPKYLTTHNREGGITTRTDKVHTGGGAGLDLNGENMVLSVWDGGRVHNHPLLEGRVTQIDNPPIYESHSTHVSGTMIGTGAVQSGQAKGMAPMAEMNAWDFAGDGGEIAAAAAAGMLVSNHSYGYGIQNVSLWQLGYYDGTSRAVDNIAYNAPFWLGVYSAGNDRQSGANSGDGGYDYLTDRGCSKNNIVVAAVSEVLNYTGPGSVNMSSFSSWGPTDDGRIKPDISAKGVNMYSSVGTSGYDNYSGTSMATPNTSGSLILLQQHYNDLNGSYMLASTLRGLALHTADEAGTSPGPDYRFGWGLLNIERAAEVITNNGTTSLIVEEELLSGEVYTFSVQADGVNDLVASITWTDLPGTILPEGNNDDPTPILVNDLDLRVSQDGGATFLPWKLDPANFTAPATNGDNIVDNIEKIEIGGATGEYIIQVSHKGGILSDDMQAFSLIVTGIDKEEFTASSHEGIKEACAADGSATIDIDLGFNDGFTDTVDFTVTSLPAGTTGSISPSSLSAEGTVVLTVDGIGSLAPGDYDVKVTATGSTETTNVYVTLRILDVNVPAVGLTYPADGAIDLPIAFIFEWELGESIENYDFELSRDETFTTIDFSENVTIPEVFIGGVQEGAEYFWRVRANNVCAEGTFSDVWSFTVEGVLGTDDNVIEDLVIYPNPVRDVLNITAQTEISSVEVRNVLGQVMLTETSVASDVQMDMSSLSSGTYFVRINSENSSTVVQVIKQ